MDDFEGSKENINAIPKGRRLKGLSNANPEKERKEREKLLNNNSSFEDFIDYIDWTRNTFTSGHLSIMKQTENACRLFRKDPRYKNDERYVDLWMSVLKHQKDPQALFKYLVQNEIGQELTIFYEQYAAFHETFDRFEEADEILRLGIAKKAKPVDRIVKLYNDFLLRREEKEMVEPEVEQPTLNVPKLKPALFSKSTAFKVFKESEKGSMRDELFPEERDGDFDIQQTSSKENEPSREIWAGSTLKQNDLIVNAPKQTKVAVFKDEESRKHEIDQNITQTTKKICILNKKEEKKADMLELMENDDSFARRERKDKVIVAKNYSSKGQFISFEENRAKDMGYFDVQALETSHLMPILNSPNPLATVLDLDLDTKTKPPSPTIHTKGAMQDIFEMFNAPLPNASISINQDEFWYKPEDDETITKKVYKRPMGEFAKLGVFKDDSDDEDSIMATPNIAKLNSKSVLGKPVHMMTPLTEQSEPIMTGSNFSPKFDTIQEEQVPLEIPEVIVPKIEASNPCDPTNLSIRYSILKRYKDYCKNDAKLQMHPNQVSSVVKDLCTGKIATLPDKSRIKAIKELSNCESGSQVFMVQDLDKRTIVALKAQSTASVWEYYMLQRLSLRHIDYISVDPLGCVLCKNESLLMMNYHPYGSLYSILENNSSLEEIVVVFWIWEILGILLTLQQAGIIHGDFSLHNFYLKKTSTVQDRFNPTGKGGWGQFGLVLLDWACSIDMEAFPPGQKFEITASNDPSSIDNECYEFRNGGTWTWEPDYYGTACILHLLMFGTPLETNEGDFSKPNLNIKKEIPNGWNQSLWNRLFLVLLNTIDKEKIKMIRLEMEQYLIENSGSKHLSELLISFE